MSGEKDSFVEPFEYSHFNVWDFNKLVTDRNVKLFYKYPLGHWSYWEPPIGSGYSYFHKRLRFIYYINFFFLKPKFMGDEKFVFTIYDVKGLR